MKKVLMISVFLLTCLGGIQGFGQGKIGYISMPDLIQAMPETKVADTALQKYGNDLQQQIQLLTQEVQTKMSDFQAHQDTMSQVIKEVKTRELTDSQKSLQDFQTSAQTRFNQKQQELLQPIVDKAKKAIAAVAKSKGFTFVFNTGNQDLLVMPDADDLLPQVKAYLGIK